MFNEDTQTSQGHGEKVAGVIIATTHPDRGVSPQAQLFASAFGTGASNDDSVRSIQHLAEQNNGDVRAINMSFDGPGVADGSDSFTQGIDWSARAHDVLYVVARGNRTGFPLPTDHFNGITVAASKTVLTGGIPVFRGIDPGYPFDQGADGRELTHIVAPGDGIRVPVLGGGFAVESGTSLAAPHVVGAVALLQQYADASVAGSPPLWVAASRRHEVMKVVLMNSADKLKDAGDGLLLGMTRDVLKRNGNTWAASPARDDPANPGGETLPLDPELGTGHLNVRRALTQVRRGPVAPGGVPSIGWDFRTLRNDPTGGVNRETAVYQFSQPLRAGSHVSITLAWDRIVRLQESLFSLNGRFDDGETFSARPLTNLDLELHRKNALPGDAALWRSRSDIYNVEHIFFEIPADGEYEFWVKQRGTNDIVDYAVAWWALPAPPRVMVLTPNRGPAGGGTGVRIQGIGFEDVEEVYFDFHRATILSQTSTDMVVISPPHRAGTVDVRLVTASTSSDTSSAADDFTYFGTIISRPPVAEDDVAGVDLDVTTSVVIDVLANDLDPDGDPLTVSSVTQPPRGSVSIAADGKSVTYNADPSRLGEGTFTFTYTATDGTFNSNPATVTVTVYRTSGGAPLVFISGFAATPSGQAIITAGVANENDPDGDVLSAATGWAAGQGFLTGGSWLIGTTSDSSFFLRILPGSAASALGAITSGPPVPEAVDSVFMTRSTARSVKYAVPWAWDWRDLAALVLEWTGSPAADLPRAWLPWVPRL